jgi:hypothetical protein
VTVALTIAIAWLCSLHSTGNLIQTKISNNNIQYKVNTSFDNTAAYSLVPNSGTCTAIVFGHKMLACMVLFGSECNAKLRDSTLYVFYLGLHKT